MWLVYATFAAIVWGLDYALGERVLQGKISPFTILAFQMAFGTIVFGIIGYFTRFKTDFATLAADRMTLYVTIAAVITFSLGNLLIFLSIGAKNATIAGIIELSYPIFTIFFSWLLFNQVHTNLSVIMGGLLIAAGVFVIGYFN